MSVPDNFHVSFGYEGTAYDLNLVKGRNNEKSDYIIKINGITYSVLGDEDKLATACKILNSISFTKESPVTEEYLKEKLSALEDITSPIVEKAGNLGLNTLRAAQMMSQISPTGPLGGADPISPFQTQKLQGIINSRYETVPPTTPVGCNLIIMKSGVKPVRLNAGNLPLNAPQHWGSVSKQFTAACIAKLVDQKKINWTDDIRDYLPELPEFKWGSKPQKVTIDDLAHMRSGLPELGIWAAFSGQEDRMLSMDERRKLLANCPDLLFEPGTEQMYCNDNYFLLAEIVERVANKPVANKPFEKKVQFFDFVRDEIFLPLKMECRYSVDPSCPKTVDGYDSDYKLDKLKGHFWGAFGIVGPPTDMAKWNDALESGKWDSLMSPPSISVPQGKSLYCRGLKVADTDDYSVVYHTGSINGFCARFMRYEHKTDPSKTFAFFLATNTNNMDLVLRTAVEVADVLAGKDVRIDLDELSEMSPPAIPIKASLDVARPYEGEYERPSLGLRYRIDAEDKDGVPILHFSLLHEDGGSHEIADLKPTQKEGNPIVYQGGAGEWIERTRDGIVLQNRKMAPIIFKRKQ